MRGGYQPVAIDLFGDVDLAECCPLRIWDYQTESLLPLVRQLPSAAWLYTGVLENRPDLVQRLAQERRLYGNDGPTLAAVRDPWKLAAALKCNGFRVAELSFPEQQGVTGKWIRKPLFSSGGSGVRRSVMPRSSSTPVHQTSYLQRYVEGKSYGAVYLAGSNDAVLLGTTQQLIGTAWTGGTGFRYCGSIGPLRLTESEQCEIARLGSTVSAEFDLQGIFGVDFIVNQDGVWTLEVNPRYTASVEVLERAAGFSGIQLHVDACEGRPRPEPVVAVGSGFFGKAIVFSRRRVIVDEKFRTLVSTRNAHKSWPEIADIPPLGSILEKGRPVTTVFAQAATMDLVASKLRLRTYEVQRALRC